MELNMLIIKGIFRRHKETGKLIVVTMFSVFFMAAILLFQKNIFSFQMQNSKEIFGDWIVMENTTEDASESLLNHPYISGVGKSRVLGTLYDKNYNSKQQKIGCFDDEFIKRGNVSLYKGTFPSADNEIALDFNTLTQLGYSVELGQTIDVYYIDRSPNASSKTEENKLKKEYILTGIFHSYITLWNDGDKIPGLIISESAFEQFGFEQSSNYIYTLNNNIETDDYSLVFNGLKGLVSGSTTYNKNVYDNKLWDSASVYNMVLFLIMGLGIVSITFQMILYASKRKPNYYKLRGMGASIPQIRGIITIECLVCTLFAAVMGIIISVGVGWVICKWLSVRAGITQFFIVDVDLLIRVMLLTVVLLIISVIIVQVLSGAHKVTENSVELTSRKLHIIKHMKLKRGNVIRQFISRRINTRIIQSLFSRILIMGICVMLILCANQIYKPYLEYRDSLELPDFEGILLEDLFKFLNTTDWVHEEIDSDGNRTIIQNGGFSTITPYMSGRTNAIIGFDEAFINTINKESGISSIKYSNMESTRAIIENSKNGYNAFCQKLYNAKGKRDLVYNNGENNKPYYLYVSQYNTLSKEQYEDYKNEIPENLFNYDDYRSGNQVILFLNSYDFGDGEEYDTEIKPGDMLSYKYLYHVVNALNLPYYNAIEEKRKDLQKNQSLQKVDWKPYNTLMTKLGYDNCATPTVAAVIEISIENINNYHDLLPQQGYYTVLASEQLGRNLVENEYNVISEFVDSPDCSYKYNRIDIMLNLNSEYEGTTNVISQLFAKYNVSYTSNFEVKQLIRENFLNAIWLYGTAFIAILMVFLVIKSNMLQAELDNQKRRFKLLKNLGADNKTLISIIVIGFLRENVWAFMSIVIAIYLLKLIVPLTLCLVITMIALILLILIETIISMVYVSQIRK